MSKWNVYYHFVNGNYAEMPLELPDDVNKDESIRNLVQNPFVHIIRDDQITVVNMSHVVCITFVKQEETV